MHDYIDCMCFNPVFNKMQEVKIMIREFQMSDTESVRYHHGADESYRGRDRGIKAYLSNGMGTTM